MALLLWLRSNPLVALCAALFIACAILKLQVLSLKADIAMQQAAQSKAIADAAKEVMELERKQVEISSKVSADYEKQLHDTRLRYADAIKRMRNNEHNHLPTVPGTPAEFNAITESTGFSRADVEFLIQQAQECELNTLNLIFLQKWVTEQKGVTRPPRLR